MGVGYWMLEVGGWVGFVGHVCSLPNMFRFPDPIIAQVFGFDNHDLDEYDRERFDAGLEVWLKLWYDAQAAACPSL
jgi:hypothetical protein